MIKKQANESIMFFAMTDVTTKRHIMKQA